jgi:hypothetical protein
MIKVGSLLYDDNCISLTKAISMASIAKNRADSSVPKNFRQARKHPDYYTHWLLAMEKQHKQLQDIGTWELVDLPEDARALPGKWVYDEKVNQNDEKIERARWVVCGNFQEDSGYGNTYGAVASATTVRIFLALAAVRGFLVYAFDLNTAFLNAYIPNGVVVYVDQPTGLGEGRKVCLLKRALYGLREAPLYWFLTISPVMKKLGFEPFDADLCVFLQQRARYLRRIVRRRSLSLSCYERAYLPDKRPSLYLLPAQGSW